MPAPSRFTHIAKVLSIAGLLVLSALLTDGMAQSKPKNPSIGYVYPAGGQRGDVFRIMVGGMNLGNVSAVHITGEGATAEVVRYLGKYRRLKREERILLNRRLAEVEGTNPEIPDDGSRRARVLGKIRDAVKEKLAPVELPRHPMIDNLEALSAWERDFLRDLLLSRSKKKQPNAQIGETVLVEVTLAPDATPGDRSLRLETPFGLTNPLCFQVGLEPEIREDRVGSEEDGGVLTPPLTINGQVKPGEEDRFAFRAKEGQCLVIETKARHLVPYLADAVPGWFQATVALFDDEGHEIAFADDYRFDPDPVLRFEVPRTGRYELAIRDAIYRGREDFVYRIRMGTHPFITSVFPMGGPESVKTAASIEGWNLPRQWLALDTAPGGDALREVALIKKNRCSNFVPYVVSDLPECLEAEPNDDAETAPRLDLPVIVNGQISDPRDRDVFAFKGHKGDRIVAEVLARRIGSPLDSLLRLFDAKGKVIAWNDDHEDRGRGLVTHHADAFIEARLPRTGIYRIELSDTQRHGGEAYGYRLRISPPRPDFALRMTPSGAAIPAGRAASLDVHVLRKEGFDGEIALRIKDAPPGFVLNGGRIPAKKDRITVTLSVPRHPLDAPVAVALEGWAETKDGRTLIRPVVPAEDRMQAFLYRHLVPAHEFLVSVKPSKMSVLITKADDDPVRMPMGDTVTVDFQSPRKLKLDQFQLELASAPDGLSLGEISRTRRGFSLAFNVDRKTATLGVEDNLIVEAFIEREFNKKSGKGAQNEKAAAKGKGKNKGKRRISLGVLPAIPVQIVRR